MIIGNAREGQNFQDGGGKRGNLGEKWRKVDVENSSKIQEPAGIWWLGNATTCVAGA